MGNVSTRKDGVEECEDFDQSMESSAGGTHGTGNPHGGRDGEGPSGIKKFEECQQYMDSAHVKGNVSHGRNGEGNSGVKKWEEGHQCMDFSQYGFHVMGNVGGGINGEGHSGIKKFQGCEQYVEFRRGASPTSVCLAPSHNLGPSLTAIMLPPQPLMVPSQRPVRSVQIHGRALVGNTTENEGMLHGRWVTIQIRWSYGGKQVAVEGSWDDWKSKELLAGSGKEFSITKVLPLGIYHFRFIVDGQWRNTPELPLVYDNTGYAYNVLDLKNYVPEDPESPSSPGSSYNNPQLVAQDFEREPPELPPQAEITPLNGPSFSMDSSQSLTRPQTFVLNHLYIQKMNQNVVALSSTHRFCTKHVTIVLYKPRRG